jgi:hypothetical protein
MAVVGPTLFAAFVWANVFLVLAVFAYEIWALFGERKAILG